MAKEQQPREARTPQGDGPPVGDTKRLAAATAKVGPKGQIVIPKDVRDMFGIQPGDTVLVLADADRGIAVRRLSDEPELIAHLFGETFPEG